MSQIFRTQGITLSRHDHREADRIYSVLTDTRGKLELRAKGSRKILAKLSAHLEPFAVLDLMVVRGRYSDIIAGVERIETYPRIRLDGIKILLAGQLAGLVDMGIRTKQCDQILFFELRNWLRFLNSAPEINSERAAFLLASFTLKLMAIIGYRPELRICVGCRHNIFPGAYRWQSLRGGVVCKVCCDKYPEQRFSARTIQDNTLKLMRYSLAERPEKLLNLRVPGLLVREFHELVESLIVSHFPVIPAISIRESVLA